MKPQLGSPSSRTLFVFLFLALALFAYPARSATCTSANINPGTNDPVAFVVAATSPGTVSVVDLATNVVVCSIAVGNNPSHLALSPDSSLLIVENDGDPSVWIISLADPTIITKLPLGSLFTPAATAVTGNIATTFDGTHTFAYVAVYPNPLPATPAPFLARINLDVSPPTLTSIGSATVNGTTPANGDVGVSFVPDGTKSYITFDGNNTDVYATATDTFSASIPVTGGSFTVSPIGDLGYVVQTAATASSSSPNQITIATNAFAATTAVVGQTICSRSNTTTTSPDGTVAYYSCPANNSLQFITASSNQVTNTVNLKTAGSGPNGIAATSDGSSLVVANNIGTISVFTSLTSATPAETDIAGPGGALIGIGQRPVRLTISPTTPTINTTGFQQFSAGILYAFKTNNLTWSVDGNPGGNATVGFISATGRYTPPSTTGNHTISVSSPEISRNSKLYPNQSASTTITVVLPITVTVAPKTPTPTLNLSTATTLQFTGTVQNDPANKGVIWAVDGVSPGTTTTGTIAPASTASGAPATYTAPKMINPPNSVQITATSVSDPTATDTATLNLSSSITFSPITFNPPGPLLIETPDTLSTSPTGDPYNQGVTWAIKGCSAATPATAACGSINANTGAFTPPTVVPYASQTNPVAPATITFSATSVTDSTQVSTTAPITITSNVVITGFQLKDNTGTTASQLLIETPFYSLTPTLTGDTGKGVNWSILSCSADPAGGPLCGSITAGGTYTPPKVVPYALPVTSSSIATITFKAVSIADILVFKTFPINIGSTVAITGFQLKDNTGTAAAQLLIENTYTIAPTIAGDTGQGVTWSIVGCSAANPVSPTSTTCGQLTKIDINTGAYAPPKIVPYALPVTSSSTASVTFEAVSVADPKVVLQPAPAVAISSNISITGFQITPPSPNQAFVLVVETSTNNFSPVITGDTGQGATWAILKCSADSAGGAKCGSITSGGTYTPPKTVPYASPVTSTSTAFVTFQATSVADPKVVSQPEALSIGSTIQLNMPASIPNVMIGGAVDFTPNAASGNVTLLNDTGLGVTLAITGTCVAPPNYSFTGADGNGCGSFPPIGSQTASPPTYAYTAPGVVPMSASCAMSTTNQAGPASCLGTQKKAQITITATSVADPTKIASSTFMISSNISFALALGADAMTTKNICNPYVYSSTDANIVMEITNDPCGFNPPAPKTAVPTLAVGFPATLMMPMASAKNFGNVPGLTFVPSAGSSVQPAFGTSTTFAAPSSVPNSGNATVTGYAIADFTVAQTFSIPVVASKLIPHNFLAAAPFTPVVPFTLTVLTGQSSGSIPLDFLGPNSGQISFTCLNFFNLTNSTCAFNPNPANATGTTTVGLTVTITRVSGIPLMPPRMPAPPLPGLPVAVLAMIIVLFIFLAFASRKAPWPLWVPTSRWHSAIAALLLCAVILTWATACGQFSQPSIPKQPVGGTPAATGSATVTASPTTSPSTDSLAVPTTVQQ